MGRFHRHFLILSLLKKSLSLAAGSRLSILPASMTVFMLCSLEPRTTAHLFPHQINSWESQVHHLQPDSVPMATHVPPLILVPFYPPPCFHIWKDNRCFRNGTGPQQTWMSQVQRTEDWGVREQRGADRHHHPSEHSGGSGGGGALRFPQEALLRRGPALLPQVLERLSFSIQPAPQIQRVLGAHLPFWRFGPAHSHPSRPLSPSRCWVKRERARQL